MLLLLGITDSGSGLVASFPRRFLSQVPGSRSAVSREGFRTMVPIVSSRSAALPVVFLPGRSVSVQ